MTQAKYSAQQIAQWFINWAYNDDDQDGDDLTNLKVQKLLYYAQGHYLARYGKPLFSEPIQAWAHGPVVPEVYREMKYSSDDLAPDSDYNWSLIDEDTASFLAGIWDTYGQYSAWKLRNMSHDTAPWKDRFNPDQKSTVIPNEAIRQYFSGIDTVASHQ
ncbi:Panacea domain-containing protein [Bombiscardovia apis]|uniref:Panacea domain-containing protein n=1 Tax=Bombiscardovia apis TaxID=2932182 RepID=UPI0029537B69|nr:type II toxin-antitoxin system antitoxin SocA domain-containing protein [Bombiscardovia apis]